MAIRIQHRSFTGVISLFKTKIFVFNELKTLLTQENLLYKMRQLFFWSSCAEFEFNLIHTFFCRLWGSFGIFQRDTARFFFCLIGLLSPLGLTRFLYTGREAPNVLPLMCWGTFFRNVDSKLLRKTYRISYFHILGFLIEKLQS